MTIAIAALAGLAAGYIFGTLYAVVGLKNWHTCHPCPVCEMLRDLSERKAKPWPDQYRFRDRHYWDGW